MSGTASAVHNVQYAQSTIAECQYSASKMMTTIRSVKRTRYTGCYAVSRLSLTLSAARRAGNSLPHAYVTSGLYTTTLRELRLHREL
jgi:hypothetical protein